MVYFTIFWHTKNFFFFFFLGPYPWQMEFPRLGVELELQLLAYTTAMAMWDPSHICNLHHSSWQDWNLNPLREARDWTCILMNTSLSHNRNSPETFFFFCLFRATSVVYGGSQARGWIGAALAGLHYSHSNARSELCLTYTTAHSNAGSLTHWARPGIEPASSWVLVRFITTVLPWELTIYKHFLIYKRIGCRILLIFPTLLAL